MKPLHEIADVEGGSTPRRDVPEYWNGNIPWATPTDLSVPGAGIANISRTKDHITDKGLASCSAKYLPVGTVLYSSRATIGKIAVAAVPLTTNQGFANLVPHEGIDSRFLAYSLWFFTPQIETLAGSTTFREVSRGNFRRFKIPVPPLDEQHRIVRILDEAESLRQLRARADERMADFIPALFNQMFGDSATNPKGWRVHSLHTLVAANDKVNYGVVQPGDDFPDGVPIVRIGDFSGMRISRESLKRIDPAIESAYARSRLKGDEVLVACVGSIGLVALADESLRGYNIVRAVARIRCSPTIDRVFLAHYLMTRYVQSYYTQATRTVAQPTLNIKQIEQTKIMLPPLTLQRDFVERVAEVRALQDQQARSRSRLEAGFQAVLHRAFEGEL